MPATITRCPLIIDPSIHSFWLIHHLLSAKLSLFSFTWSNTDPSSPSTEHFCPSSATPTHTHTPICPRKVPTGVECEKECHISQCPQPPQTGQLITSGTVTWSKYTRALTDWLTDWLQQFTDYTQVCWKQFQFYLLIHHIPIAITIIVTIIIITMRSHSFAAELLQRVAVRSTSVAAITLYMLLALSCDHYSVVQCSASDRLNESLLASQHYNRILKFAKCQVRFTFYQAKRAYPHFKSHLKPFRLASFSSLLHFFSVDSTCTSSEHQLRASPECHQEVHSPLHHSALLWPTFWLLSTREWAVRSKKGRRGEALLLDHRADA